MTSADLWLGAAYLVYRNILQTSESKNEDEEKIRKQMTEHSPRRSSSTNSRSQQLSHAVTPMMYLVPIGDLERLRE